MYKCVLYISNWKHVWVYSCVAWCWLRVRVPLRRAVLRGAPVQRQARVLVRLPGAGRAGDPPQQPRRGLPEDPQDMSLWARESPPSPHRITYVLWFSLNKYSIEFVFLICVLYVGIFDCRPAAPRRRSFGFRFFSIFCLSSAFASRLTQL